MSLPRNFVIAPRLGDIAIALSFTTRMSFFVVVAQLFRASSVSPFASEASPTTATMCSLLFRASRAAAIPRAAASALPACPATKASAALSSGFTKGDSPPCCRSVVKGLRRFVSSFQA